MLSTEACAADSEEACPKAWGVVSVELQELRRGQARLEALLQRVAQRLEPGNIHEAAVLRDAHDVPVCPSPSRPSPSRGDADDVPDIEDADDLLSDEKVLPRLLGSTASSVQCISEKERSASGERDANAGDDDSASETSSQACICLALPTGWPGSIQLRQYAGPNGIARQTRLLSDRELIRVHRSQTDCEPAHPADVVVSRRLRFGVLNPNSTCRVAFDAFSIVVLFLDMIALPYTLAFEMDMDSSVVMLTMCFWSLDMGLSFVTGFYRKGELVMKPAQTAKQYLTTWFLPDLMAVGSDWADVIVTHFNLDSGSVGGLRVVRLTKVTRLLRIIGLVRLVRRFQFFDDIMDRSLSDNLIVVMQVVRLFVLILWLNHVAACFWFWIGTQINSDTQETWLTEKFPEHFEVSPAKEVSPAYLYSTSLHWAMSQITPGSMDVNPTNTLERVFNILFLCLGLLVVSSLVSSMSATLMRLDAMRKLESSKLRQLRRFLRQNDVRPTVAMRVQKYVVDRMSRMGVLEEKDVDLLLLLSSSMRTDLGRELFERHVICHPLLRLCFRIHAPTMAKVCSESMRMLYLLPKEVLFSPGAEAQEAWLVLSGAIRYTQLPESSRVRAPHSQTLFSVETTIAALDSSFEEASERRSTYLRSSTLGNTLFGENGDSNESSPSGSESPPHAAEQNCDSFIGFELFGAKGNEPTLRCSSSNWNSPWLSEVALWCHWVHVGVAEAWGRCEQTCLVVVDAQSFQDHVRRHPVLHGVTTAYGKEFHRRVLLSVPPASEWPTDIRVPGTDYEEIVPSLGKGIRAIVSYTGLQALRNQQFGLGTRNYQLSELEQQIHEGSSVLAETGSLGAILRMVSVVLLRVQRCDERILMRLGVLKDARVIVGCKLPGAKVVAGMTSADTVRRVLETDFGPLLPWLRLGVSETVQSTEESARFRGLRTRYVKTVQHAELLEDRDEAMPFLPLEAAGGMDTPPLFRNMRFRRASSSMSLPTASPAMFQIVSDGVPSGGDVFAWLSTDELEQLQSPGGQQLLEQWLQQLRPAHRWPTESSQP